MDNVSNDYSSVPDSPEIRPNLLASLQTKFKQVFGFRRRPAPGLLDHLQGMEQCKSFCGCFDSKKPKTSAESLAQMSKQIERIQSFQKQLSEEE